TYFNLGMVLLGQGKNAEAEALFRKAFEFYPKPPGMKPEVTWAWAIHNFSWMWERFGKLDEAAALCRKAIQVEPASALSHSTLGWVLWRQGKLDEAAACYRKAIDLDPKDANTLSSLGWLLRRQGKRDEAAALYRKALEIDPKDATARNGLAAPLKRSGN